MNEKAFSMPDLPAYPRLSCWEETRAKIVRTLALEEYGVLPDLPVRTEGRLTAEDASFCAGKCVLRDISLTLDFGFDAFSFPVSLILPQKDRPLPFFVFLNFRPGVPDKYMPAEEIVDRGYGLISVDYDTVSHDGDDGFSGKLDKILRRAAAEQGVSSEHLPGKIAFWAFAAGRMLDYLLTLPQVDPARVTVIGHSRLGKTALWAAALDTRFGCAVSNDSGCSGAAVTRGKTGEHIADITRSFPYWFCSVYRSYAGREEALPFDQHWLLSALAPRLLLVGSALEDTWADPYHEYRSCIAASGAWTEAGQKGFVCPDRLPEAGECFHEGDIGYHLRSGSHYLSRTDWNFYMDFLDKKYRTGEP